MTDEYGGADPMYASLQQALDEFTARQFTGTSENTYVTVTADHDGLPVDIQLNPRIRRLDSDDIRTALLEAITAAREEAHAAKEEALRSVFGPTYSSNPSPNESSLEHTQSMITTIGRHARQTREGGQR